MKLMNNLGTVTIETSRLILRQYTLNDAYDAYSNWTSDTQVTKFLRWEAHKSVDMSKSIISNWISQYDDKLFYNWVIELKDIGQPIGNIAVVGYNEMENMVHIGYCLGKNWWGKSIMTEALEAVIKFMFEQVGAVRVESQFNPINIGSGRVMAKAGMIYEKTIPNFDKSNAGTSDAVMYALHADEYFNKKTTI